MLSSNFFNCIPEKSFLDFVDAVLGNGLVDALLLWEIMRKRGIDS